MQLNVSFKNLGPTYDGKDTVKRGRNYISNFFLID